jgi:hypothetical protein
LIDVAEKPQAPTSHLALTHKTLLYMDFDGHQRRTLVASPCHDGEKEKRQILYFLVYLLTLQRA